MDVNSYRPITTLSNAYKLFTSTLNRRLQEICEKMSMNILSEAQNGFRLHRRTSNNIFILS